MSKNPGEALRRAIVSKMQSAQSHDYTKAMVANMTNRDPACSMQRRSRGSITAVLLHNESRKLENGYTVRVRIMVRGKFNSFKDPLVEVSPNGLVATIKTKMLRNAQRAKGDKKEYCDVGKIPLHQGRIIDISRWVKTLSDPKSGVAQLETHGKPGKLIHVSGLFAEIYKGPNTPTEGRLNFSFDAITILPDDEQIFYNNPGGMALFLNEITPGFIPEGMYYSCSIPEETNTADDQDNLLLQLNGDKQQHHHDGDNPQNLLMLNDAAGVQALVVSGDQQEKEPQTQEEKEAEKKRQEAEQKEKRKKKRAAETIAVGNSYISSLFTGNIFVHIPSVISEEERRSTLEAILLQKFREATGDPNATILRNTRPHKQSEIDPKTMLPMESSDFFVIPEPTSTDKSPDPIQVYSRACDYHFYATVSGVPIMRTYTVGVKVPKAFPDSDKLFLTGLVGSSSDTAWLVAQRIADYLDTFIFGFLPTADTRTSDIDPVKLAEKPTYEVSVLGTQIYSNIAWYVLNYGMPISVNGTIKRLEKRWFPVHGANNRSGAMEVLSVGKKNGEIRNISVELTQNTLIPRFKKIGSKESHTSYTENDMGPKSFLGEEGRAFNSTAAETKLSPGNMGCMILSETTFKDLSVKQLYEKYFLFSVSAADFPRDFLKFLHTLPHDEACQITDLLFAPKLNPNDLEGNALKAFNLLGEQYDTLLSLDNPELTYAIRKVDADHINLWGTGNLALGEESSKYDMPYVPFECPMGKPGQFSQPLDIYHSINSGQIPSEEDILNYYSQMYERSDILKSICPTMNMLEFSERGQKIGQEMMSNTTDDLEEDQDQYRGEDQDQYRGEDHDFVADPMDEENPHNSLHQFDQTFEHEGSPQEEDLLEEQPIDVQLGKKTKRQREGKVRSSKKRKSSTPNE